MNTKLISGKHISNKLKEEIADRVNVLRDKNIMPGLAVILVGNNPASEIYVRNKYKTAESLGIYARKIYLPDTISEQELINEIESLNSDDKIHGILVQLPLPKTIREDKVIEAVSPLKDVDGFHPFNVGLLWSNPEKVISEGHVACTPYGCLLLLHYLSQTQGYDLSGKQAVIIGRSNIVGKPMASLLLHNHCTVTCAHSRTQDLKDVSKQADILVVAVGKPEFITRDFIKKGAVVIDVGINRVIKNDKNCLVGDVDFDDVIDQTSYITPVPGGVGPMTIACLMRNTVYSACTLNNLNPESL